MNRLSSLEIRGFKSIRSARLDLDRLNILIGANCAGKSNLLSFFELLRSFFRTPLRLHVQMQGGANSLLFNGAKETPEITATVRLNTGMGPGSYQFRLIYAAGDSLALGRHSFRLEVDKALPGGRAELRLGGLALRGPVPPPDSGRDARVEHEEGALRHIALHGEPGSRSSIIARFLWRLLHRSPVYHFLDTTQRGALRQSSAIAMGDEMEGDGANLAAVLYEIREKRPACFQMILSTIRLAYPYFDDFVLPPPELRHESIALRWREQGARYELGPHQISDGLLRFIALVTLLSQGESRLPSLILIDEPELGLHPHAISILAGLLAQASRRSQVIVATQSPLLVSEFDPESVVIVERAPSEGLIETRFRRLEPTDLRQWLEDYSLGELWEKNVLGGGPV